jgi:glyoxylase-like metal-dependent hydrolase (beta-lactamase superfamily II)
LFFVPAAGNGRFPFCHSLAADGANRLLIDAGYGTDRTIDGTDGWRPDAVYVSHAHPDHVASLWTFTDAEIWSPVQRSDIFWRFEPMSLRYGGVEHAAAWLEAIKESGVREVTADHHFDDGHVIDTGTVKLECLHAPGHTDDHYVFYESMQGVVFTCDIDLSGFGPWYGQAEGDIDLFLASIRRVAELRPRLVVSSHKGVIVDDIQGRLQRFADVIHRRDELLLGMLDSPATTDELVDSSPIFRAAPHPSDMFRYWEGNVIRKHFARLEKRGIVACDDGRWHRV